MSTKLSEKLMPPEVFEATMNYFVVRQGNSREIAHAYHVLGLPASTIAAHYNCTKQNVVKVLARYAKAYERYTAAKRNVRNAPPIPVPSAAAANESLTPPAPKAPASKAAAKKTKLTE